MRSLLDETAGALGFQSATLLLEWTRFFDPRVKGCLVNQDNQHWVSIKSHGDRVLLFDSRKRGPIVIDEQGYKDVIRRHRMTFWVVKHDCDLE